MKRIIFILLPILFFAFTFKSGIENTNNSNFQPKISSGQFQILPAFNPAYYDVTNWTISGRQILKDGKPFFAKGVGYQPTPVGENPARSPNGDYFTSNYAGIYKPDLDKMYAMGVNSLRIYSWYPDKDHTDFLNYAYSKGIYVIIGYYMPPGTIVGNFNEKLGLFKQLAENTKTHPGIMGYQLGNENVGGDINNPTYWNNLNAIASALKSIAPNKIVTTGLVDDGENTVRAGDKYMTSLDVWGINIFRGKTLGPFYPDYLKASKKPVLITELGFPCTIRTNGVPAMMPDNSQAVADYVETVMEEINENSSDDEPDDPVAGVYYFMFSDEWWKQVCPACYSNGPCACADNTHDFTKENHTANFPGGWWDEEWFGLYTADGSPRKAVDVLKEMWKK
jgi:exo-beta-1,3-glucanase (GH17 family)